MIPGHPIRLPQRLVLASRSPRRRQLLIQAGYRFDVVAPDESVERGKPPGLSPVQLVQYLSAAKATSVAVRVDSCIVLAADTVAEVGGRILGKPTGRRQARQMLQQLAGTTHSVHTGVCIFQAGSSHRLDCAATTRLAMDQLSDDLLRQYLDSGDWRGKAGAFGFQDNLPWIRIIQGSESNVVGLPMELLGSMFTQVSRWPAV